MVNHRCQACAYQPLAQHTSVRPPPWLPDGEHHVFYVCKVCGSITVQAPDNQNRHGQLWVLEPGAMALLRTDVTPSQVIKYISSEDFFNNRTITDGLFRYWVRAAIDVSMCVNDLIGRCGTTQDPRRLLVILDQLVLALTEVNARVRQTDVRCRISTIDTIFAIASSQFPHSDASPKTVAAIRLTALSTLELLARPDMVQLLPPDTQPHLELAIDHGILIETSRQDVALARQRVHSTGPFKICEEALFLKGLFEQREAHLTVNFSVLMWSCLLDLHTQMARGGKGAAHQAYAAVQALLEHQLVAFGLEHISWHTDEGSAFQDPRTDEILLIRRLAPQVECYPSIRAGAPSHLLEAWMHVLKHFRFV